ncbi:MAG: DUF6547 family protein [Pseudomonadota bacterium]
MSEDLTPNFGSSDAAYRWLIDQLADFARVDDAADRIRKNGHLERLNDQDLPLEPEEARRKEFMLSLNADQREAIVSVLSVCRQEVAHSVATFLDERMTLNEMQVSINGVELGESPYVSYHFDLICRLEGDEWPDQG